MKAALYHLTIAEAARLIAARELSPVNLVEAFLARIVAVDGQLHSYITVVAEEARAARRASGPPGDNLRRISPDGPSVRWTIT